MGYLEVVLIYQELIMLLLLVLVPLLLLLLQLHQQRRRRGSSNSNNKQASSKNSNKNVIVIPPSPPGCLPVIGHLHLIGDRPHASLRDLAADHGSGLMLLRLGSVPNLVVSSARAAEAVLRTHDHVFASRPASMVTDALLYGSSDIAFAPYGEHWRKLRRLVTSHLFTVNKVQSFSLARKEEVVLVMAKIREATVARATVDLSEMMNAFSNDIVCRAVSGKFFRAEGRNKLFRELIAMNSVLFGGFRLEDYFLGIANSALVRMFTSCFICNKAQEGHKRWDDLLEKILTDHESRSSPHQHEESDFIDAMLSVQQEYSITRDHIKAVLMDMFGAATDTSSLVLELAMAELMRNPHLMTKLQTEVRNNTPKGHEMVVEEGLATMSYLKAVVKETLRLHPPSPLLLPRISRVDCQLDGYTIPRGTRIVINSWAISRDPESWKERLEEFMPERFMEGGSAAGIDFKGHDFHFLPFGAGRRICPGLNFGLATVEIMLANLIYCFYWELPGGMQKEDIDMTEVFGLTVHLKEKLVLVPRPC